MARYIDLDKFENYYLDCIHYNRQECGGTCTICYYNYGGVEEVAPVIHSSWDISYFEDGYKVNMKCLNCGKYFTADYSKLEHYNYCPNCGAKMDKV